MAAAPGIPGRSGEAVALRADVPPLESAVRGGAGGLLGGGGGGELGGRGREQSGGGQEQDAAESGGLEAHGVSSRVWEETAMC